MLAPLAPHIAEELWARLGDTERRSPYADFPTADPALLVDDTVEIPVQVNGKVRARVTVAAGADEADARGRGPRRTRKVARAARGRDGAQGRRRARPHRQLRPRLKARAAPGLRPADPPFRERIGSGTVHRGASPALPPVSPRAVVAPSRRSAAWPRSRRQPSREEREFWDAQFHDDPTSPIASDGVAASSRVASSGSPACPTVR